MIGYYAMAAIFMLAVAGGIWWWSARLGMDQRQRGLLCLAILLGMGCCYALAGNHGIIRAMAASPAQDAKLKQMINHVRQAPDDVGALLELALFYREQGRHDFAAPLLRQASTASGGQPDLLVLYGESLVLSDGGLVKPEAARAFEMARLQQPQHLQAAYFIALRDLQAAKLEDAQKGFTMVATDAPEGHPLKAQAAKMAGMVDKAISLSSDK